MKKITGTIMGIMVWGFAFSQGAVQTGINTLTPQQALHVSGTPSSAAQLTLTDGTTNKFLVTPTARVDGLNKANNVAHTVSSSVLPLYATKDGDLVIGSNKVSKVLETKPDNVQDAIVRKGFITVTSNPSPLILKNVPFTLTRTSMVYISATVAIGSVVAPLSPDTTVTGGSTTIKDYVARMIGVQMQFSAAPDAALINVPFAASTNSYTNGSNSNNIPTGFFWYTLGKEMVLPPGTYNLQLYATAGADSAANGFKYFVGGGRNDTGATAPVGSTEAKDQVNIIAIAL